MLGKRFRIAHPDTPVDRWRTAVLAIPGARPLTIALTSDRHGCAALAAAMLGMDADGLDLAMIDDFLRELLNMTAGQIKLDLALDQALGVPRMVDADAVFAASHRWSHHVLDSGSINLVVSLIDAVV